MIANGPQPFLLSTLSAMVALTLSGSLQAAAPKNTLEEIIVTAERRESNIQDIAGSVQAFSGADLDKAGVVTLDTIGKLTPGITLRGAEGIGATMFIRGVGNAVNNAYSEPSNAFSVDGIFFSRPEGPDVTFFDVERIEVLKGPQGTLYGRNATAGAVNLISRRHGSSAGNYLSAELGNYELQRYTGAADFTVSDNLGLRVAFQSNERDGFMDDGYSDSDTQAVRGNLVWTPTDRTSLYTSLDYAEQGGQGPGYVPHGPSAGLDTQWVNGQPWSGPSAPAINQYSQEFNDARNQAAFMNITPDGQIFCGAAILDDTQPPGSKQGFPFCSYPLGLDEALDNGYIDNSFWGANITLEHEFDFGHSTTLLGYRDTDAKRRFYYGPQPQETHTNSELFSFESRLSGETDKLQWIGGVYYSDEQQTFTGQFDTSNTARGATCGGFEPVPGIICVANVDLLQSYFAIDWQDVQNESWAVFASGTYSLTDTLRAFAGARYSEEEKSSADGTFGNYYSLPAGTSLVFPSTGKLDFDHTDYRVGVEYDIADSSMLYASVSTGFHAGGFNIGTEGEFPFTYKPEELTAYAIGSKNRLFDNSLQLNIEAFYWDYTDLQIDGLGPVNAGDTGEFVIALRKDNAGDAWVRGVELNLQWAPWDAGMFTLAAEWTQSEYENFSLNDIRGNVVDYSGEDLAALPPWVVNAGYQHSFNLDDGGQLTLSISSQWRDDVWMWYAHQPGNYQESYFNTDLVASYLSPGEAWELTAYVRNLEDNETIVLGGHPLQDNDLVYTPLHPRQTYGASLTYRF